MIRIPGFELDLTDEERDRLLFNLVLTNRHLAEVNSYLICRVLSEVGMSEEQIDETLKATHEFVGLSVERKLSEHKVMTDDMSDALADILGDNKTGDPEGDV